AVRANLIFTSAIESPAQLGEITLARRAATVHRADTDLNVAVVIFVDDTAIHKTVAGSAEAAEDEPVVGVESAAMHRQMTRAAAVDIIAAIAKPNFAVPDVNEAAIENDCACGAVICHAIEIAIGGNQTRVGTSVINVGADGAAADFEIAR